MSGCEKGPGLSTDGLRLLQARLDHFSLPRPPSLILILHLRPGASLPFLPLPPSPLHPLCHPSLVVKSQ